MDVRLRRLAELDPTAVPLPHGTEVSTRVDRALGDEGRVVPQGAVGRVVSLAADEDAVNVAIVGVGVVRYARHEIVPRKVGQVRYAHRRVAAWSALRPCVVLEAVVGSRAWGLADVSSDVDRRGIFALPLAWTVALSAPPLDLISEDGSETYWEARKAIDQALRADPNTLELLFVDSVRATDEIGAWILEARDAFVSSEIHGTFARYAMSQLARLRQASQLAGVKNEVLDWLRESPPPSLDEVASRLADRSPRAYPTRADALLQAKQSVKQLYRSLHDQGLIPWRDHEALIAFARVRVTEQTLELPREVRPKNAYNLLRLIATAIHWLRTGTPKFVLDEPLRSRMLAIKRGEVPLDRVLADAEALASELEDARLSTCLPRKPDVARVDALSRRIGEELARRHVMGVPGPFAQPGSAVPPLAEWEKE